VCKLCIWVAPQDAATMADPKLRAMVTPQTRQQPDLAPVRAVCPQEGASSSPRPLSA